MNNLSTVTIWLAGCLFAVSTPGWTSGTDQVSKNHTLSTDETLCNPPSTGYGSIHADDMLLGDAADSAGPLTSESFQPARLSYSGWPTEAASSRLNPIKPLAMNLASIHPLDHPANALDSGYADIISAPLASLALPVSLWIAICAVMGLLFIERRKSSFRTW